MQVMNLAMPAAADDWPAQVEWLRAQTSVAYPEALAFMEERVARIAEGHARELVWFLEHPPIYTAGTSAKESDLLEPRFPIFRTGRGGQFTYHGPGQRVAYVMLDLRHRRKDIRTFVRALEEWLIATLAEFEIKGERRRGRIGIWIADGSQEKKIAAIGVRVRRWVTYHGVSLNIAPDLSHFSGIVPCGVREHGVTSFADLGVAVSMEDVDRALRRTFARAFP